MQGEVDLLDGAHALQGQRRLCAHFESPRQSVLERNLLSEERDVLVSEGDVVE